MIGFALQTYTHYLRAIKSSYQNIFRFDEYFLLEEKPENFCLIRHDIDRNPRNALLMAEVENKFGIQASYYFRTKRISFKPDIITKISALGHEIGYHYESFSDMDGNSVAALLDFGNNLKKIRRIAPVKTISMHGRPLSRFDNRDLWRDSLNHSLLKDKFNILGEIYLDIDYTDIAYINDTGRNWYSDKSNLRDRVDSKIKINFKNNNELLEYLRNKPHSKLVFQIHPERWSNNLIDWVYRFIVDNIVRCLKDVVRILNQGQK